MIQKEYFKRTAREVLQYFYKSFETQDQDGNLNHVCHNSSYKLSLNRQERKPSEYYPATFWSKTISSPEAFLFQRHSRTFNHLLKEDCKRALDECEMIQHEKLHLEDKVNVLHNKISLLQLNSFFVSSMINSLKILLLLQT